MFFKDTDILFLKCIELYRVLGNHHMVSSQYNKFKNILLGIWGYLLKIFTNFKFSKNMSLKVQINIFNSFNIERICLICNVHKPVNPGSFHCSRTPTTQSSRRTLGGILSLKKSNVCRIENIFSISGSDLSNGLQKIIIF